MYATREFTPKSFAIAKQELVISTFSICESIKYFCNSHSILYL